MRNPSTLVQTKLRLDFIFRGRDIENRSLFGMTRRDTQRSPQKYKYMLARVYSDSHIWIHKKLYFFARLYFCGDDFSFLLFFCHFVIKRHTEELFTRCSPIACRCIVVRWKYSHHRLKNKTSCVDQFCIFGIPPYLSHRWIWGQNLHYHKNSRVQTPGQKTRWYMWWQRG